MMQKGIAIMVGTAVGLLMGWSFVGNPFGQPLPPPPEISVARGAMPATTVAFEERIDGGLAGSGFYLGLPDGRVIGVTTAHSMLRNFTAVTFRRTFDDSTVGHFSKLSVPFSKSTTDGMRTDYALMTPDEPPDPSIVLKPDPRGGPQPGERVTLYSGLDSTVTGQRVFEGTVEETASGEAWVRMDTVFQAGLMSGSPFLSQHTGKVVGVTTSMLLAPGPLRIGICPIRVAVHAATNGEQVPE